MSKHLGHREASGLPNIPQMAFTDVYDLGESVPTFVRQHPYLTHLEWLERDEIVTRDFSGFLLDGDWESIGEPKRALRYLRIDLALDEEGDVDCENLMEKTLKRRSNCMPFARLEVLVLRLNMCYEEVTRDTSIPSIPRYSQIAKALVQLFGPHFELRLEFEGVQQTLAQTMRSQLTKEVSYRQEKEKAKPKLCRLPWS